MRRVTGKTYYDALARDTVAMIVNDVIVVGAEPPVVTAYWAVGASSWFDGPKRAATSSAAGQACASPNHVGRRRDAGAGGVIARDDRPRRRVRRRRGRSRGSSWATGSSRRRDRAARVSGIHATD
jgi:hypothetical protein